MSEVFSERLALLRKEKGWTQKDLADIIQSRRTTVAGYEKEGKEPNIETLCRLASLFGVSTDYLLGYSDYRTHAETLFFADNENFKRLFSSIPPELRPAVAKCFDSFYLFLGREMKDCNSDRLALYRELFSVLLKHRSSVRATIQASGGSMDSSVVSELMEEQSKVSSDVSELMSRLLRVDMEIGFGKSVTGGDRKIGRVIRVEFGK